MRNCLIILALILLCFGISLPGFAKPSASANPKISNEKVVQTTQKVGQPAQNVRHTAQKDVDFAPFMHDLQVKVKRAWYPPKSDQSKQALVVFRVDRDGKVSKVRVTKSTGIAAADQAAIKAIEAISYKVKLPPDSPGFVDIQFTFDYNVYGPAGQKTAGRHSCNNYTFALIVAPLLIFLFVGLINVLVHLQRKRAPIWLIGSVLLGMFAAMGFLWPFLNTVK